MRDDELILENPLEDRGALLDGTIVADGEKFGPKSVEFRSVVSHLNQPFGECKLGLERIRASIRSDLIHVSVGPRYAKSRRQ